MITRGCTQNGWWSVCLSVTRSQGTRTSEHVFARRLPSASLCWLCRSGQNKMNINVQVSVWPMVGKRCGWRQSGADPGGRADDPQHRERWKDVSDTPDAAVAGDDEEICYHLAKQQTKWASNIHNVHPLILHSGSNLVFSTSFAVILSNTWMTKLNKWIGIFFPSILCACIV